MSLSVRPQFNQITRMSAFRAAGIPDSRRHLAALLPAAFGERPRHTERKKFCMSMITKAVLEGEMMTGVVEVERRIEDEGSGSGK